MVAILPCFIVSIAAKDNLSGLLKVTGGFCGVILMLIIPSGLIISSRNHAKKIYGEVSHIHKSLFEHISYPIIIFILGIICFGYSGYINIKNL